jgi:hypothetical protein
MTLFLVNKLCRCKNVGMIQNMLHNTKLSTPNI